MDPDIAMALGLFIGALAVTSGLSALADSRPPRIAAALFLAAAAGVLYALGTKEGGYALADLPMVFIELVAALRGP